MQEVRALCHTVNTETSNAYKILKTEIIWGKKRYERDWRKFFNEKFNDLYVSSDIVRMIKSRRIRLAGHVVHMGERRGAYRILVGKPEGKGTIWTT